MKIAPAERIRLPGFRGCQGLPPPLWVVKKLSDLEMNELRRIKDSTVLPLNLAVKTLLLTQRMAPTSRDEARPMKEAHTCHPPYFQRFRIFGQDGDRDWRPADLTLADYMHRLVTFDRSTSALHRSTATEPRRSGASGKESVALNGSVANRLALIW
jgi:hypothetical protein